MGMNFFRDSAMPGKQTFPRITFSCKMQTVIDHFSVGGESLKKNTNSSPWISKRRYKTQNVCGVMKVRLFTCRPYIPNDNLLRQ